MSADTRDTSAVLATTAEQVRVLLAMDRHIRKESGRKRLGMQVLFAIGATFMLLTLASYPALAEPGRPRNTAVAISLGLIVIGYIVLPVALGRGGYGLQPEHVRRFPVTSTALRRALLLALLRSPPAAGVAAGLIVTSLWIVQGRPLAIAAAILLTFLALIAGRVAHLVLADAMRTQTGRIIGAIGTVLIVSAGYITFIFLGEVIFTLADNVAIATGARRAPSGWGVLAAESAVSGQWWLAVVLLVGLAILVAGLGWCWRWQLGRFIEGRVEPPASSARRSSGTRSSGPKSRLGTALEIELQLCRRDPRRVGLLMLPVVFLVIGVMAAVFSFDVYGLPYGAPLVIIITGSVFANSYGLDGASMWRFITHQRGAPLVIDARLIVIGSGTALMGVIGTSVGRLIRPVDPSTIPIAIAVIIAGTAGVATMSMIQSSLSPYRVEQGSVVSALTARGSMSGMAFAVTLLNFLVTVVVTLPGVIVAIWAPGGLAWLGALLAVGMAAITVSVGRRVALRLLAQRGPKILAAVA